MLWFYAFLEWCTVKYTTNLSQWNCCFHAGKRTKQVIQKRTHDQQATRLSRCSFRAAYSRALISAVRDPTPRASHRHWDNGHIQRDLQPDEQLYITAVISGHMDNKKYFSSFYQTLKWVGFFNGPNMGELTDMFAFRYCENANVILRYIYISESECILVCLLLAR